MSVGVRGGTEWMQRALELSQLQAREAFERECAAIERRRWIGVAVVGAITVIVLAFILSGLVP
jgi:hypothetical protein